MFRVSLNCILRMLWRMPVNDKWVRRETKFYDIKKLKFDKNGKVKISNLSEALIKIPCNKNPIDFGAICFTKRKYHSPNNSNKKDKHSTRILVKNKSFRSQRLDFVGRYIEFLYCQLKLGKSISTLGGYIGSINRFISWCEINATSALDDGQEYINALSAYTEFLIEKIRMNKLNINTAAIYQKTVFLIGESIYLDSKDIRFNRVKKIRRSFSATNITEKPNDKIAAKCLKIYNDVFSQFSDIVLEFKKFPMQVIVDDKVFWFFPTPLLFVGPSNFHKKSALKKKYKAYDFENGRLRSIDEIIEVNKSESTNIKWAEKTRNAASAVLKNANEDRYNGRRMLAASLAFQAFIFLLSSETGMSLEQLSTIEWSDDEFVFIKNRQGFRSVKYRANGRVVNFLISNALIPRFKRFLLLRSYILTSLKVDSYPKLFFAINYDVINRLGKNFSTNFHNRLKKNFGFTHKVTTRKWRANKSDFLVSNFDIGTTALILQNSPSTVSKHYMNGSESNTEKELSNFFEKYMQTIIVENKEETVPVSLGQCSGFSAPRALSSVGIEPDCVKPEGCLSCDKFKVHADSIDYRKLLSCKYVIEITKPMSAKERHFEKQFRPVINRLDDVMKKIVESGNIEAKELHKINMEVYEHELLDPYWLHKLRLLESLDLI